MRVARDRHKWGALAAAADAVDAYLGDPPARAVVDEERAEGQRVLGERGMAQLGHVVAANVGAAETRGVPQAMLCVRNRRLVGGESRDSKGAARMIANVQVVLGTRGHLM